MFHLFFFISFFKLIRSWSLQFLQHHRRSVSARRIVCLACYVWLKILLSVHLISSRLSFKNQWIIFGWWWQQKKNWSTNSFYSRIITWGQWFTFLLNFSNKTSLIPWLMFSLLYPSCENKRKGTHYSKDCKEWREENEEVHVSSGFLWLMRRLKTVILVWLMKRVLIV